MQSDLTNTILECSKLANSRTCNNSKWMPALKNIHLNHLHQETTHVLHKLLALVLELQERGWGKESNFISCTVSEPPLQLLTSHHWCTACERNKGMSSRLPSKASWVTDKLSYQWPSQSLDAVSMPSWPARPPALACLPACGKLIVFELLTQEYLSRKQYKDLKIIFKIFQHLECT